MSTFDPALFEQQVVEEASETVWTPVPAGEYAAMLKDFKVREGTPKSGGDPFHVMDIFWSVQDQSVLDAMEQDEVVVKQSAFLDLGPQGQILFGQNKNIQLGLVRDALRQNASGQPWSPSMLRGAGPVKITVKVDPPTDDGKTYNRVTSVVAHSG